MQIILKLTLIIDKQYKEYGLIGLENFSLNLKYTLPKLSSGAEL